MRFSEILRKLIEETGLSQRKVSNDLQIPPSTLAGYLSLHEPDIETLKLLANYFNCTVDYLVGAKSPLLVSDKEEDLLRVFRLLSDEQQDICVEIVKTVLKCNQKKGK